MPKYFIGNILSPTETQPEANDPTFAFTREESEAMSMTDIPIRMEHHPDMVVGNIIRDWDDKDGRKWVLGKLNDDGFQSKFAKYAIDKGPSGTAYYTGLSLQHTHTQFASGKSVKTPIEVSLCVNPRRDDCRIAFVDSEPNHDESKKVTYKIQQLASNKMSEAPLEQQQDQQTEVTTEVTETPVENKEQSGEMSREEMMKVIIQQQKELETQQSSKSEEQKELEELKIMLKKQKDEEASKTLAAAKALSEDLVNQWAQSLDKTEMTDANKQSILKMAQEYPQQSMELLRVAHCASKAHQAQVQKFDEFKKMSESMQLKERFESVMQKKRERPVEVQTHAASTKKQKVVPQHSTENYALSIIKKYRASGSARDHMSAINDYQTPKRRGARAPYY